MGLAEGIGNQTPFANPAPTLGQLVMLAGVPRAARQQEGAGRKAPGRPLGTFEVFEPGELKVQDVAV
jgi:hypothetical protein